MHTRLISQFALALALALATACGGSQKHVESQDFTEKGWSGPSSDGAGKADPPIQSASGAKADEPKAMTAEKDAPLAPSAPAPQTSSAAEASIVSGSALPPSPLQAKPAKPTKAKKPGKTRKKASQAARG